MSNLRTRDTIWCEVFVDDVQLFGNGAPSLDNDGQSISAQEGDSERGERRETHQKRQTGKKNVWG